MNTRSLIGGLLAGAAVGVAVGMLLAPASGKETQFRIARGTRRLVHGTKDVADETFRRLKGEANHALDGIAKIGKGILGDAKVNA